MAHFAILLKGARMSLVEGIVESMNSLVSVSGKKKKKKKRKDSRVVNLKVVFTFLKKKLQSSLLEPGGGSSPHCGFLKVTGSLFMQIVGCVFKCLICSSSKGLSSCTCFLFLFIFFPPFLIENKFFVDEMKFQKGILSNGLQKFLQLDKRRRSIYTN